MTDPEPTTPAATPTATLPPSGRGGTLVIRAAVALAVIGGVAWFVVKKTSGGAHSAADGATYSAGSGSGSGGGRPGGGGAGGPGADRVVPVRVATAAKEDLPIWLEGLGSVAAVQQVTVRPQVDGRLDSVTFTEGKAVKKGDVLAQVDPRPFLVVLHQAEGALARDKATLAANQAALERAKSLKAQNLIAQAQVDDAQGLVGQNLGAVQIDQAQIESARLNLDYATIRAPLDGVTGVRLVDAGNLIRAADASGLVVITAIDPAAVLFSVPQDRLAAVAAAIARGPVAVEVWNRDGTQKLADATLAVLDNQINASTATLKLKALAKNPDHVLWPNAFVKARMLLETRAGALVVPAVAVQRGPQGPYVYVVDKDGVAQLAPVTVGLLSGERAVIAQGLVGGEQVVIEGHNQIRPGGKVAIAKPPEAGKGTGTGKGTGSAK